MKRSGRLNPKSKKTAKEDRELAPIRRAYLVEFPECMVCGNRSECVHEIASGTAGRAKAKSVPATWLATCGHCNCEEMTDKAKFPVKRQLAIKLKRDPKNWDLPAFNECYTLGEVHLDQVVEYIEWT
jgi:hypothetical protein